MAKGDTYTIHIRNEGEPIVVTASKAGRKLAEEFEKDGNVQWLLVHEQTWTNKTVRTTRFSVNDITAIEVDIKELP